MPPLGRVFLRRYQIATGVRRKHLRDNALPVAAIRSSPYIEPRFPPSRRPKTRRSGDGRERRDEHGDEIVTPRTILMTSLAVITFLIGAGHPRAGEPSDALPAGRLDLVVRYRMESGRLTVRLDDRAIYSVPLAAGSGPGPTVLEHRLSLPSGRRAITVQFFDGRGRLVEEAAAEGTVGLEAPAVLTIAEHRGFGDGLTLSWRTP